MFLQFLHNDFEWRYSKSGILQNLGLNVEKFKIFHLCIGLEIKNFDWSTSFKIRFVENKSPVGILAPTLLSFYESETNVRFFSRG
jgi:hypothetical protein